MRVAALVAAVAGLGALTAVQLGPARHRVEDELSRHSAEALRETGREGIRVGFTGRDATIEARNAQDAAVARDVVAGVDGVRRVTTRVAAAAVRTPAWVSARVEAGGLLRLDGTVPGGGDRDAIVAAAGRHTGTITVSETVAGSPALAGFAALVAGMPRTGALGVRLRGDDLSLSGTAPDERARTWLAAAGRATGAAVTGDVRVPALQPRLDRLPPVSFESGGATLTAPARAALQDTAALLAAYPSARLRVEGHTDGLGAAAVNLTLSHARAAAVRDFLTGEGTESDRLSVHAFGETRPLVPDDSAAHRARNRRVELIAQ
jgi:outer membrane protein OmpA-like peptidoglycan-associated protein